MEYVLPTSQADFKDLPDIFGDAFDHPTLVDATLDRLAYRYRAFIGIIRFASRQGAPIESNTRYASSFTRSLTRNPASA